jgi:hypothetical protein
VSESHPLASAVPYSHEPTCADQATSAAEPSLPAGKKRSRDGLHDGAAVRFRLSVTACGYLQVRHDVLPLQEVDDHDHVRVARAANTGLQHATA